VAKFFKVRVFDSGRGAGQAPLLMTATLQTDEEDAAAERTARWFPGPLVFWPIVAGVALLAIGLAWLAWRSTLGSKVRGAPSSERMHAAMDRLRENPQVETVQEKLNRMASDHGDET
jgi:hypothetical protein